MVTIKEIASECGVSPSTVSNILNGKTNVSEATKQRVLSVVKERGYHPNIIAQGLRRQRTQTIGIIAEDLTQFTLPEVLNGAIKTCEENGYKVVLQNLRLYSRWEGGAWFENERLVNTVLDPAIKELSTIMVDGIIYVAGHGRNIDMPKLDGTPIVLAYSTPTDKSIPYTVIDDREAAYTLTKYLMEKGHRKIGVIAGVMDNIHTRLRLEGYQQALYDAGILYNLELVIPSTWYREGGYRDMAKLIERGCTAVFCMNDRMAGGAYEYCYEHGLVVGKDISIVGFDDEIISQYMVPQLTTMQIPLYRFGVTAVRQLLRMIEYADRKEDGELKYPLPIRSSGDSREEGTNGIRMHCLLQERNSVADLN